MLQNRVTQIFAPLMVTGSHGPAGVHVQKPAGKADKVEQEHVSLTHWPHMVQTVSVLLRKDRDAILTHVRLMVT